MQPWTKPVPKTNKINPNINKYLDADIAVNVEQPSVQIANNLDIEYFEQAHSQISDISKNPSIVCTTPTNEAREINLDSEPENDVKLECNVNLNSDIKLDEFPVPVSIVGICIGILDHMTPYKQLQRVFRKIRFYGVDFLTICSN